MQLSRKATRAAGAFALSAATAAQAVGYDTGATTQLKDFSISVFDASGTSVPLDLNQMRVIASSFVASTGQEVYQDLSREDQFPRVAISQRDPDAAGSVQGFGWSAFVSAQQVRLGENSSGTSAGWNGYVRGESAITIGSGYTLSVAGTFVQGKKSEFCEPYIPEECGATSIARGILSSVTTGQIKEVFFMTPGGDINTTITNAFNLTATNSLATPQTYEIYLGISSSTYNGFSTPRVTMGPDNQMAVSVVPEPESAALLLGGLGVVGGLAAARRRREGQGEEATFPAHGTVFAPAA